MRTHIKGLQQVGMDCICGSVGLSPGLQALFAGRDKRLEHQSDHSAAPPSSGSENATKAELALAYIAMDKVDGAKELLHEVMRDGTDAEIEAAKRLLAKIECGDYS